MCSWDSQVNYLLHHIILYGEMKRHCTICESKSVLKALKWWSMQFKVYMSNFPSSTHQSIPHSEVYEDSHKYFRHCETGPLELLHGATLSWECCHSNLYRCVMEPHFCQPAFLSRTDTKLHGLDREGAHSNSGMSNSTSSLIFTQSYKIELNRIW